MNGKGVLQLPDGSVYDGYFVDDKREGFGIFKWADGRYYEGTWKEGKQEGEGYYCDDSKGVRKKGMWKSGKRISWL